MLLILEPSGGFPKHEVLVIWPTSDIKLDVECSLSHKAICKTHFKGCVGLGARSTCLVLIWIRFILKNETFCYVASRR
jgi:hypothetical protein